MAAELAETDRVRRDLVANVSHELRTPITALQARAREPRRRRRPSPIPRRFRTMLAQVERLGRLVEAAPRPLTARVGHGAARAHGVPRRAAARARGARAAACTRPGSTLSIAVDPPDLTADGDPERVHQVVANLLENAVRSHAAGGRGRGARPSHTRHGVVIEVIDEGPGIPESERPGCSSGSTAPTRHGRRATAAPASASRSPVDRRPPRRRHPSRAAGASRLPHGRHAAAPDHETLTSRGVTWHCQHRRRTEADPARRDGPRRRRRRPRERGRPHDGSELGHRRGGQLHAALGPRARLHAVRRPSCIDALDVWPDGAAGASRVRHRRSPCRSTTSPRQWHRRRRPCAHDPHGRRPRRRAVATSSARATCSRCAPVRWRARAARPHRGGGRPRGARRAAARRRDLRGAPRRRLAGALRRISRVRRGPPHRDGVGRPDRRVPPHARRHRRLRSCVRRCSCSCSRDRRARSARAYFGASARGDEQRFAGLVHVGGVPHTRRVDHRHAR